MKIFILGSLGESLIRFRGSLLTTLRSRGCTVFVAAPKLSEQTCIYDALLNLRCVPRDVPLSRTGLNPFQDFYTLWKLIKILRNDRPTHFLAYTVKPVLYGIAAAWLAGVQHRTALITGLGYAFNTESTGARRALQKLLRLLYKFSLNCSTAVIFQNPDDRDLFVRLGLVAYCKTALVNGSGVPLTEFPQVPFPHFDRCHFLLIARLLRDKGVYEYVESARAIKLRYPNAIFHLVGWIDSNPSAIKQTQLDNWITEGLINFHGRLSDVRDILAACHIYVLPSYREGTPRTVLEAMATGRPIITTDAPGCRETVIEGKNGFLIPPQDVGALSNAMEKFLRNPELIPVMGQRSREIVEEKYDVHKVNADMLRFMGIRE